MTERILLVDDEPFILSGYRRGLGKQFTIDTATSGTEALEMFGPEGSSPYAVVVSDMRMPEMDGVELLERLAVSHPEAIRIMLTGNSDQQTAINAVNQGHVFKFLSKPCAAADLKVALEEALERYRSERERERIAKQDAVKVQHLSAKLIHQTRHDILTGLANRHAFELRLKNSLESAKQEGRQHIFCFIDIDHFHRINDACGYTAGDELLRQLGGLLSHHRRSGDLAARLGSDQFGLILSDCNLQDGQQIIHTLHEQMKQHVFHWEESSYDLSVSIGLVPVTRDSDSVAALFSAAETACNVAKDEGRNQVHIGDEQDSLLTQRLTEIQWISRINKALKEHRFRLYYQTIEPINQIDNEGEHYEILIRMLGEEGEIIPPGEFLPAAEHYHLSPQIDRWVILNTLGWLNDHPDQLQALSLCSINLSGLSIGDREMLTFIQETLENSNVPPSKICLEVTETAAIAHLDAAVKFMQTLKAIGVRFSLDDFGTGLSSFAYLRTLPVDFLKIDGMFVRHIARNIIDWTLVKSINDMGQIMGKQTIAEFVEDEDIYNQLHEIGANYAQGYLLSKPSPLLEKGILLVEQES
ncbi:EAL domain-containing response regulator [Sedimenticola sp.]|uniref:EAL domain-containing response regulator n=1 Tax=Sedimenticola sp. TaxID=1940285 RepID=UPI003D0B3D97